MLSVVGNRPQFIKSAPLSEALREQGIEEVVVHTGQHYDPELSQVFFEELGLPEPRYRLDVGGLGRDEMLEALRPGPRRPDRCGTARLGARLRRHELDARRRPGGGRGRRAARPRRVGAAQLRPVDAGGAQPGRDRPAVAAPVRPGRALAGDPRGRERRRPGGGRRGRDDGRQPAPGSDRAAAIVDSGHGRSRAPELHRHDSAPRGERRRAAPPAHPAGTFTGSSCRSSFPRTLGRRPRSPIARVRPRTMSV